MRSFFLLPFVFASVAWGQLPVSVSASNYLRYGTGNEAVLGSKQKRDYVENLTEAKIGVSDFVVGFRLLYDSPPEYGVEFTGIRKRFVEFKRDDLTVRAGDSYTLYGRGLALNLFERRTLAYDTGLDGIKADYVSDPVSASVVGGNIRYVDVLDLTRVEDYRIRAGSVSVQPLRFLTVGFSFVSGKVRFPLSLPGEFTAQFDIPELVLSANVDEVSFFTSYAEKRSTPYQTLGAPTNQTHRGTGFYSAVSYSGKVFGISAEYKDYRFGIADPFGRIDPNRAGKTLAFQNPPIVHREHSFTLLSRYPHVIDFDDEVGYQVDIFCSLLDRRMVGSLNFAAASRHYSYTPTGDTSSVTRLPIYRGIERPNPLLPSFEKRFSPFWEFYAELEYYFDEAGSNYVVVGFNRRSNDTALEFNVAPGASPIAEAVRSTAVPMTLQHSLNSEWVLKVSIENQWVRDEANLAQVSFRNHLLTAALSRSPRYSLGFRYEFSNDKGTVDGHTEWPATDIMVRVGSQHQVTVSIGRDRGGLVCANGVCRIVPPFSGVRFGLLSYL